MNYLVLLGRVLYALLIAHFGSGPLSIDGRKAQEDRR